MNLFLKVIRSSLLVFACLTSNLAIAVEPAYFEQAIIILNLSDKTDTGATGSALATACEGCTPLHIEITPETRVYLNGSPTTFNRLGTRIDWQGSVFYLPGNLPVATELFLNN